MTQPRIAIAITADDKTAAGIKSAEKRAGLVPKHLSANNRAWARDAQATASRTSAGFVRSFASVERASARAFGGRSLTAGFTSRLGAIRTAGVEAAAGMAGAAESGGMLSTALTGLGVAAGGTVAVLGALAYKSISFVNDWAKGAAQIGRMADTMGVARKEMQQFEAASQRMGLDTGTGAGAIGSLSQTLNDARYGRNNQALAVLGKMGVRMQLNSDGTVAIDKMLPDIANAMARLNSSGRRTAAHALGLPDTMIPVFAQGGKALSADMADAQTTAYIASDDDIARGKRIQRKGAMVGQMKDRAMAWVGREAATIAEPGYDAVLKGGRYVLGAGAVERGGAAVERGGAATERGGRAIERAAGRLGGGGYARDRSVPGITPSAVRWAQAAQRKWGAPASAALAQYMLESGGGRRMPRGSNNPFGIKEFNPNRPRVWAMTSEYEHGRMVRKPQPFRAYPSIEAAFDDYGRLVGTGRPYRRAMKQLPNLDRFMETVAPTYATDPDYQAEVKRYEHQYRQYSDGIPLKVEIDMRGAPQGTRATVTAGHRSRPAVSSVWTR